MTTWNVKGFEAEDVSDDGRSVSVKVDLGAGRSGRLKMDFDGLDWLQQALLILSVQAYDKQVVSGSIMPSANVADTSRCEAMIAKTNGMDILVQMQIRQSANAPLGMGSFSMDAELALHLARRLQECAEQIRQSVHPS